MSKFPYDAEGRALRPRPRVPHVPAHLRPRVTGPLPVTETLAGKRFVVVGGTGFLGKVLVSLLLKRFPEIAHIYLMVRGKAGMSPDERFMQELWPVQVFDPLREGKNEFEAIIALQEKLTPIGGDVTLPKAGVDDKTLKELRAVGIDAVLNVSGVVDFTPPIDEGFQVNSVGVLNLIDLCHALGSDPDGKDPACAIPMLHTSTCYVAGSRTGIVYEELPSAHLFPRESELDAAHWDPMRELDESMAIAREITAHADDAERQSFFVATAREKLRAQGRPTSGEALESAVKREKKKWTEDALVEAGMSRARHWGWPNSYTYTKAIGEQLLERSGIRYTIVRPAVVESSLTFPFPGWNEGINTSAPLVFMALQGHVHYPTKDGHVLDVIPVDHVCFGTVLAAAALLRDEHDAVYQLGTSDANGFTMNRLVELTGLVKRKTMRAKTRGNPLLNRLYARIEPIPVSLSTYEQRSSPFARRALKGTASALSLFDGTPLSSVTKPLKSDLLKTEGQIRGAESVMRAFVPFISELDYRFRCDHTRAAYARTIDVDKEKIPFTPELLDWRTYWQDVHIVALKKWVFPHIEARLTRRPRAEERFSDLVAFVTEICEREGSRTALQRLLVDDTGESKIESITYRELLRASRFCAARLADAGIRPGTRVAIVAKNDPRWAIGFFGVLQAGGTVVAIDPALPSGELQHRMAQVGAETALLDASVDEIDGMACFDLAEFTEIPDAKAVVEPPDVLIASDDVALVAWTSGASGAPKPVALTHKNVTTVLASVAPLFKLTKRDSGLSVLPLFTSFELTCGLLVPMLRGARVTYVDDITTERLTEAFKLAGTTAMIGVPQVWEELEEKLERDLKDAGPFAEAAYQAGVVVHDTLKKTLGLNLGRLMFRSVSERLGGKIRFMVSVGGHVPTKTAKTFKALGIELKQGWGLTEGGSLLSLGDVGRGLEAAPGVELKVHNVGDDGVGEIITRGDVVMHGYVDDESQSPLGADGWLRTGDLGRVDKDGRITVVARDSEVISGRDGRRIFPRPIEELITSVKGVTEACVIGIPDGQGGERVSALVVVEQAPERAGEGKAEAIQRRVEHRAAIARAIDSALRELDQAVRPELVEIRHEPLPRTSDKKVRRPDVVAAVVLAASARLVPKSEALSPEIVDDTPVAVRPRERARLAPPGGKTVERRAARRDDEPYEVPPLVKSVGRRVLREVQKAFYAQGMRVHVSGDAHIPHNRQTIVVANHSSHLDMGLIKHALGTYGEDMVTLAAKDYFFEGRWRRTYFEGFTNLRPFDRGDSPLETLREATALLEQGKTVLIFPEGTRTVTGELAAFRSAMTYLALRHDVDILPVYVDGTYRAMPRGAMMPKNRKVAVRIGAPIPIARLKSALSSLKMSAACAKAAVIVQSAVEALRDERVFALDDAIDLALGKKKLSESETKSPLVKLFDELQTRFRPDEVKAAMTYYFSLGNGPDAKWTVKIDPKGCLIVNEKLDGPADCVMKTDVKMFTRIVREHYIPQVSEFMDGTVKTNDPDLLLKFVTVFNL
jgi:long-chain acyl-CoA synthetase